MTDQTAEPTPIVVVLYPTDPGGDPAHVVGLRDLPGYGLAGETDAQWTVNTSNDPGRIENLVGGEFLTHEAPNGLATYVGGHLVQQIGSYGAPEAWPFGDAAAATGAAPGEAAVPEGPAPVVPTAQAPLVLTLTRTGASATRGGVPVVVPPLSPDHPANVLPIGTVITSGDGTLHVQPAEPAPTGHQGFLKRVDEDATAFWTRVREGITALGHRLRGQG